MWELLSWSEGSRCEWGLSHLRMGLKSALVDSSSALKISRNLHFCFPKQLPAESLPSLCMETLVLPPVRHWCGLAPSSSGARVGAVGSIYMSKCPWAKPKIAPQAALSVFECAWVLIPNFSKGSSATSDWMRVWMNECALQVAKVRQKVLFTVRKWSWLDGESFGCACMLIWTLFLFLTTSNNKYRFYHSD